MIRALPLRPFDPYRNLRTRSGTFYKRFYFRREEDRASLVGEMIRSPEMMKQRLLEGIEFFQFLRHREMA